MSHFTVLVIGENPEEQLAPFSEHISVEPYEKDCYCLQRDNADGKPNPECLDCFGTGKYTTTCNPKSKWDWYSLGGRWCGLFVLKPGASGVRGRVGVTGACSSDNPEHVDQARVEDIDWDGMRKQRRIERESDWDRIMQDDTLVKHRESVYGITETTTKEEWCSQGLDFRTFAVLKGDEWYERGDMGWFGIFTEELTPEEWDTKFHELIDNLPGDALLSVYDCHI